VPSWDSEQYLRFAAERTRPSIELAARVALAAPTRVVDLGCGPGNSTEVLARRWPGASLEGVDSSDAMLAAAGEAHPDWTWTRGDIATWTAQEPVDVAFSNAALQWLPDHARLFPRLLDQVAPGGALAVQMPANVESAPHRLVRELAEQPHWRARFTTIERPWHVQPPEAYYDMLAKRATAVDVWTTEYLQVIDSVDGIVEWYRATGLRPWLDALPDTDARDAFLADYRTLLAPHFPARADGRVLFPFKRLFVIAYR